MQFKINLTAGAFWFIILIRVLTFETWNVIFTNYLLKYTANTKGLHASVYGYPVITPVHL